MKEPLIAAGIDAGQRYLDVGFAPEGKGFRVANDPDGIAELVGRLTLAGVGRVVLEVIGVYARSVTRALDLAGLTLPASPLAWSIRAASRPSARPRGGAPKRTSWTRPSLRALLCG